ncbi:hypothetical protein ACLOJK_036878, partial [Asimina triloba]
VDGIGLLDDAEAVRDDEEAIELPLLDLAAADHDARRIRWLFAGSEGDALPSLSEEVGSTSMAIVAGDEEDGCRFFHHCLDSVDVVGDDRRQCIRFQFIVAVLLVSLDLPIDRHRPVGFAGSHGEVDGTPKLVLQQYTEICIHNLCYNK